MTSLLPPAEFLRNLSLSGLSKEVEEKHVQLKENSYYPRVGYVPASESLILGVGANKEEGDLYR
jgi:hypothetical protein